MEFTINESLDDICRTVFLTNPEVIAFSCYVWNIEATARLAQNLKKVMPSLTILAGGPEVSFNSAEFLRQNPAVDFVIRGEGEETFSEFLRAWQQDRVWKEIRGLTWRDGEAIVENPERDLLPDLDRLPLPYGENPVLPSGPIVYYETSRGCPYNCSYCLSSTIRGVRYFSLERVEQEVSALVSSGVSQIKFVDRSFNCHPGRAMALMRFLAELPGEVTFHFEIVADRLSGEMLELLTRVKPGRFQFEIGVQSTNPDTLKKINRRQDLDKLSANIQTLRQGRNIRIHLDLIAGLPEEDYRSLARSFNWVYDLEPDYLQLGFLKLLYGTSIREQASAWGYVFKDYPPYEVLCNRWLSFKEISLLKIIEDLLQRYYNSHVFTHTLDYSIRVLFPGNAFGFYEALAGEFLARGWAGRPAKREKLYVNLADFLSRLDPPNSEYYRQLLMLDFVINNRHLSVPAELGRIEIPDQGRKIKEYLRTMGLHESNGPSYKPRIEVFPIDILALAGIREAIPPQPWYPVLFQYGAEGTSVQNIML